MRPMNTAVFVNEDSIVKIRTIDGWSKYEGIITCMSLRTSLIVYYTIIVTLESTEIAETVTMGETFHIGQINIYLNHSDMATNLILIV